MANPLAEIPIIGGMFDDSAEKAREQIEKNRVLYEGLDTPDFQNYSPEDQKWLQNYDPEAASYQTVSEDPRLKSAQMSALEKLSGLSQTGLSEVDDMGYLNAHNLGSSMARQSSQAALQNAQARGVGGSGLEFAMREMGGQEAAARTQQAAMQQAADSARQRALYATAYSDDLSKVRGQDMQAGTTNANIINQFNQSNTQAANQAKLLNIQGQQNAANANVDNRNQAVQYNNTQKQQGFNNQVTKANGVAGVNSDLSKGYYAEDAANAANRSKNTQLAAMAIAGKPPV